MVRQLFWMTRPIRWPVPGLNPVCSSQDHLAALAALTRVPVGAKKGVNIEFYSTDSLEKAMREERCSMTERTCVTLKENNLIPGYLHTPPGCALGVYHPSPGFRACGR
jgi:hypothetical protein